VTTETSVILVVPGYIASNNPIYGSSNLTHILSSFVNLSN
ncbi:MAG: hypothetical protein ACI90V_011369, partial [Bacillariaceae sp.]